MNNPAPYRNGRRFGTLLGWDPMHLFDSFMAWEPPGSEVVWSASPISVTQTEQGATVTVDMPGVDPADLELSFEKATLVITGKRGERTYRYSVALDDTFDPDRIEAQLDKGVLTIEAHKRANAKPRKILVKGAQKSLDSGEPK
jgi:HSP20 family protein